MFPYDLWEIWNRINGVIAMQHFFGRIVSPPTDDEILVSLSPSTWKGKVIGTDSPVSKIKKHVLWADWVEPSQESNLREFTEAHGPWLRKVQSSGGSESESSRTKPFVLTFCWHLHWGVGLCKHNSSKDRQSLSYSCEAEMWRELDRSLDHVCILWVLGKE